MLTTTITTTTTSPTTPTTPGTMSNSSKTFATVRRPSAARVLLSERAHLDLHDKGLRSIAGAQEIIAAFRARKSVTKLILGHNALGDDGTRELFRFLCSEDGRRFRIAEISLNSNEIGTTGLEAIAEYLEGNQHLRELFLQNNAFVGDEETAIKLSTTINSSKLGLLSIASNQQLSDAFFVPFLSHLDSPTLYELQVSAIGLTRASAPTLTAFFSSHRSRALETLKCNGNALGARAVRAFIARLRTTNFTLQKLEVYANADPRGDSEGDEGDEREESVEEARAKWTACEQDMRNMLLRNGLLKEKVHKEALRLLTYSRALLMCSTQRDAARTQSSSNEATHIPGSAQIEASADNLEPQVGSSESPSALISQLFPFRSLPTELQQCILALLAPSLSALQRARIFTFAADPSTLRPLLPSLRRNSSNGGCIPDPASLPFNSVPTTPGDGIGPGSPLGLGLGLGSLGPPISQSVSPNADTGTRLGFSKSLSSPTLPTRTRPSPSLSPSLTPSLGLCSSGRCMGAGGSVLCHRVEIRLRWLSEVGCLRFDPDGRDEADVLWLLDDRAKEARTS